CVLTLSLTAQEAGCTYSIANNYSSTATVDDGTCVFGGVNVFDYDNDGNIAINDFIAMLSYFGDTDSDSDGVFDSEDDCIDVAACNYQNNPTESCMYSDAIGLCGGHCTSDLDGDGICDASIFINCGDDIGHEGHNYSTVQIGEQCWFAENCRYLPEVSPSSEGNDTDPYYYVYDYQGTDVEAAKSTENYETYGVLYNWPAVLTDEICPSGWYMPSDEEFTQLTDFLGGESVAGGKMKDDVQWNGSNSSGFTGLPGGFRYSGGFDNFGSNGHWWSASESGSNSWKRILSFNSDIVSRFNEPRYLGFSARCVRD
ncbi:fibrobacter succinogenes major paralogous domain-containing protein, partial [Flavobacteriales bacterium]|nr:fibrobacter succinogenes major paralogous domain-containing protein [Flavobacteriales bacterium]